MDIENGLEYIQKSIQIINLNSNSKNPINFARNDNSSLKSSCGSPLEKRKPPALVSLCLGIIGKHLEDIIEDLEVLSSFPPDIKIQKSLIMAY